METRTKYLIVAGGHLIYSVIIVFFITIFLIMLRVIIPVDVRKFEDGIYYLLVILGLVGAIWFFFFRLFYIDSIKDLGEILFLLYFYLGVSVTAYSIKLKWLREKE